MALDGGRVGAVARRLASLERRLAQLQNDTCTLYWSPANVILPTDSETYDIPTNYPTTKLRLLIWTSAEKNPTFNLPPWDPGRDTSIEVIFGSNGNRGSGNSTRLSVASSNIYSWTSLPGVRWSLEYTRVTGRWISNVQTFINSSWAQCNFATDGSDMSRGGSSLSTNAPSTVAEWLANHPEWVATP